MTDLHAELTQVAADWLRRDSYSPVITEARKAGLVTHGEIPDVIGWRGTESHVVEVKVSVSDAKADRSKPWRTAPVKGCGHRRTIITPEGLLDAHKKLLHRGWSWCEVRDDGGVYERIEGETFNFWNKGHELALLLAWSRRQSAPVKAGRATKARTSPLADKVAVLLKDGPMTLGLIKAMLRGEGTATTPRALDAAMLPDPRFVEPEFAGGNWSLASEGVKR